MQVPSKRESARRPRAATSFTPLRRQVTFPSTPIRMASRLVRLLDLATQPGYARTAAGTFWIIDVNPSTYTSVLYEYAHDGSQPIATLQGPQDAYVCSVDPSTGNLAVGDLNATIAVYANAGGSPTYYSTAGFMADVRIITYDGSGDLYFRSEWVKKATGWLPAGGSNVMHFAVSKRGSYGWNGQYLAIRATTKKPVTNGLLLYKLDGGGGKKVGTVALKQCNGTFGTFSIRGSELAIPCLGNSGYSLKYYKYPSGGNPIESISNRTFDVTISVAPNRR